MEHSLCERIIMHVDVNSAFLSWSAADAIKKDPSSVDLRTVPSAVGGDSESRHGIILAKSIPAKKYDIQTAEPVASALRKCPELILVKPDFNVYNKCSRDFIAVLYKYAPIVEQVSVDEAFIDMSGTQGIYPSVLEIANTIKDEIKSTLGFTVNVGISSVKLLAKMASDIFEKPDKVNTLFPEEVPQKMWPHPIGELYGVGKSTSSALSALGFLTIGQVANADLSFLKRRFGEKSGEHIHRAANGLDDSAVSSEASSPKSYGNSVTLSEDMTCENKERLLGPTLLALCDSVGFRLRRDGVAAMSLSVQIKSNEFVVRSKQRALEVPVDGTNELYEISMDLIKELWNGTTPVRLIGVTAGKVSSKRIMQMNMLQRFEDEKKKSASIMADRATDEIRLRYGKTAITRGALVKNASVKDVGKKQE